MLIHRAMPFAAGQKEGGQALLGGLDCKVQRNFFGAQINSFESQLPVPKQLESFRSGPEEYRAMFIRAPAIMEAGPSVEILSEYRQGDWGLALLTLMARARSALHRVWKPASVLSEGSGPHPMTQWR